MKNYFPILSSYMDFLVVEYLNLNYSIVFFLNLRSYYVLLNHQFFQSLDFYIMIYHQQINFLHYKFHFLIDFTILYSVSIMNEFIT